MADPRPVDDVSTADAEQLARWAYGRAEAGVDPRLAEAALLEIARRAETARAEAEAARLEAARAAEAAALSGGAAGDVDGADDTDAEYRHRRRMLATGLTGVVAAALALAAGVVMLAQPDPDPMAIFREADPEAAREWAARISTNVPGTITAGPRAIELGDRYVAVVTRISTVPDGQSTAWDSYCLTVSEGGTVNGAWALSTTCTYPEKFERVGLVFYRGPSATGQGLDAITWSATAWPRLERNVTIDPDAAQFTSVLDWMAYPSPLDPDFSLDSLLDEPTDLLMGPAYVALYNSDPDDAEAFFDSELTTTAHLAAGATVASEPRVCVQVTGPEGTAASTCAPLRDARRDGLDVPVSIEGRTWIVTIDPDGPNRYDSIRLAD